jgi:hypothetical protein
MKALLLILATLVCCITALSATSLAERTGESVKLYVALCISEGHDLSAAEYTAAATELSIAVGLPFDRTAYGNIALLHAEPLVQQYADDYEEYSVLYTISAQDTVLDTMWHRSVEHTVTSAETSVEHTASLELGYTKDSVVVLLDGATVLSAPREVIYIGFDHSEATHRSFVETVRDTVEIQTVVEVPTDFCPCGEYESIEKMRSNYMAYGKLIREETDSYKKRLLIACRIRMGEIVRSDWRYGRYAIEAKEKHTPSFGGGQKVSAGHYRKNKTKAPSVSASHAACKKGGDTK